MLIFSALFKYFQLYFLTCGQTFISLKHIWTLKILHEINISFTWKAEFQFVMFCWLYKTHTGGDSNFHRQPSIYWICTQTKLSSIFRRKLLCLDETSRVVSTVCQQRKKIKVRMMYFYYNSVSLQTFFISLGLCAINMKYAACLRRSHGNDKKSPSLTQLFIFESDNFQDKKWAN